MATFTYDHHGDSAAHDLERDAELTAEEARVLTTMKIVEQLDDISSQGEFLYFLNNNRVMVIVEENKER